MKLASYNHDGKEGYGAVVGDGIVDLSGALYQETNFASLVDLLAAGPAVLAEFRHLVDGSAPTFGVSDVTFRLPIPNPMKAPPKTSRRRSSAICPKDNP